MNMTMGLSTPRSAKRRESWFLGGLSLWLLAKVLRYSMFVVETPQLELVFVGVEFLALVILILFELIFNFSQASKVLTIFVILLLTVVITMTTGYFYLAESALIIVVSRNCNLRSILRIAFWTLCIAVAVVVLTSLAGIIPNYIFTWGERVRLGLGFKYATYVPAFAFALIALYGYLQFEYLKLSYLLSAFFIEAILFYYTDTRFLAVLGAVGALFMFIVSRFVMRDSRVLRLLWITPALFLVFLIGSYWLAVMYDPGSNSYNSLNVLLSDRLALGQAAISDWGIALWGQEVEYNAITWNSGVPSLPDTVNVVDSSYLSALLLFGPVVSTAIFSCLTMLAVNGCRRKDWGLVIGLLLMAIMGLFEPRLLLLEYNPFLLCFGPLFLRAKSKPNIADSRVVYRGG